MPISFRCMHCDRMLSIARRKAGTEVACPKCGNRIPVPASANEKASRQPVARVMPAPAMDNLPLFERSDFEALLDPQPTKSAPTRASKSSSAFDFDNEQPVHPVPPLLPKLPPLPVAVPLPNNTNDTGDLEVAEIDGVVVSRAKLTWIALAIALLLAVSFAVGYFLGRATVAKPVAQSTGWLNAV